MAERYHADVSGLKELRRDLIKADKRYGPEIRKVLKETAEIVASDARGDVPVLTGRASRSVKAGTSGAKAVIRGGTKTVPYYGWLDFGGTIAPRGTAITRTELKRGRFIYPAIARKLPVAVEYLQRNIAKLITKGT